jgi:RimJ/RimL family protein N-acetyltransferase
MTDFPLLQQWLNTDFVTKWYAGEPTSLEGITETYSPYVDGREPVHAYIIKYDNLPIGYIQTERISDEPEWFQLIQPTAETANIDLYIGHPDYIHRGLGSFILIKCMRDFIFSQPDIEWCSIDPEVANHSAIRAYEKAGFKYWKTVYYADSANDLPTDNYLMRQSRTEFLANNP